MEEKASACFVRNDGARRSLRRALGGGAEVVPVGVEGFDQGDFLGAVPALDFFFAGNGGAGGGVRLEPDEFGAVVFFGETGDELLFVLAGAFGEVARNTQIENAGLAGHEVDVESAGHGGDYMRCRGTIHLA